MSSNNIAPTVAMDKHGGIQEEHGLPHGSPSIYPAAPPDAIKPIKLDPICALVDHITNELGLTTELARAVVPVLIQNLQTLERKQKDYGPHNLTKFGVRGVIVRMNDKMERIINLSTRRETELMKNGCELPTFNEPMSDSFLDIQNYGLIAYVMDRGIWPKAQSRS